MTARWKLGSAPWLGQDRLPPSRLRVILDNDYAGDADGLYQLVHHLLSPTVDLPVVIGSHLPPGDTTTTGGAGSAAAACDAVRDLFARMGLDVADRVRRGAEGPLTDAQHPHDSPAARAIVDEAMIDDPRPLFVAAGGGLTEVASAYLMEPRIAERLTLVWIGGLEHAGDAEAPPGPCRSNTTSAST